MNRHLVHIYAVVRVKLAVDGNATQEQAINAADNLFGERKHQMFDREFEREETLGEPSQTGVTILYSEADDEASGYLVDEYGDEEHSKTREYEADGCTLVKRSATPIYQAKNLEDIAKAFEHCAWQATAFADRLHKTKRAKFLAERESDTWKRAAQMLRETKLEGASA